MRQSKLFSKTLKNSPKDEVSINAQLLIRAGFVDKLMAGSYSYLPLGLRVIKKIENIIREEMNMAGGQEILMPALHPKKNWEQTGRWGMDILYKMKDSSGSEFTLGPTHEEVVVPLVQKYVNSYKDLPFYAYQIQNKFRMELRAKSGLLRGREFLMKDLYSFHLSEEDLNDYYEKMKEVYFNVFKKVGLGDVTHLTFASGGTFSKYSHEFQSLNEAGEDIISICKKCSIAINREIKEETPECPECGGKDFKEEKAIEVGNIFKLNDKFSKPFDLKVANEKGEMVPIIMGCYGIGISRLIGSIVEVCHDDNGIIWPESVAPFKVHLIGLNKDASEIYEYLQKNNIEVLYDDRDEKSAGERFAEADLIGIPYRVVVSEKTGDKVEVKKRDSSDIQLMTKEELIKHVG